MIHGDFLDKLDATARHFKGNGLPFGDVRVIFVADFEQLPPVGSLLFDSVNPNTGEQECTRQPPLFLFDSQVWGSLNCKCFWLTHSWRYGDDSGMVQLSGSVRGNVARLPPEAQQLMSDLYARDAAADPSQEVTLCGRTEDAELRNAGKLELLEGELMSFRAVDKHGSRDWQLATGDDGNAGSGSGHRRPMYRDEKGNMRSMYDSMQAMELLSLKKGAHVICVKNLPNDTEVVNGSLGVVKGFAAVGDIPVENLLPDRDLPHGLTRENVLAHFASVHPQSRWPKVEFTVHHGQQERKVMRTMLPQLFTVENELQEVICARLQVPLLLRYALTIHKAQGLTLPWVAVKVDYIFAHGQLYTALTRVRKLEHMRLLGGRKLPSSWMLADPKVVSFNALTAWLHVDNSAIDDA